MRQTRPTIKVAIGHSAFATAVKAAELTGLQNKVETWIEQVIIDAAARVKARDRENQFAEAQRVATRRNDPPLHRDEYFRKRGWF